MADILDKKRRSELMARIGPRNTKPELKVRKFLHSKGLRFRINDRTLPGSPDLKLTKYNTVVFVNGCFWHMHQSCGTFRMPRSNIDFWEKKLKANALRDKRTEMELRDLGWHVIVVWECELRKSSIEARLEFLLNEVLGHERGKCNSQI